MLLILSLWQAASWCAAAALTSIVIAMGRQSAAVAIHACFAFATLLGCCHQLC